MGHRVFALITVCMALMIGVAWAEDAPVALTGDGARVVDYGGEVAVTIDLERPVAWRLWLADGPPRVVVELSDLIWTEDPVLKSSSVLALEVRETGANLSELQAILREPLGILSAEMATDDSGGARLDIRLIPTTADVFQSELSTDIAATEEGAARPVIAIDPGHGGRDPGAEVGDVREADLVLAFAHRLRDVLLASGTFDVVMTRADDTFLSLDARLDRARAAEADVLLSLHADALVDAEAAAGIVLYRLSPSAHGAANLRLQERHSPDEQLSGIDLTGVGEDVTLTLLDLARQRSGPRSRAMSASLLTAFEGADLVVNSRPERTASFAVLKAADIPSLLVELGFLSTEADLDRLTSDDWQTEAAEAIRDGLLIWLEEDRLR